MGQKVSPIGFRTGINEDWKSRWYASKQEFADLLLEDQKIRRFIKDEADSGTGRKGYRFAGVPRIEIERTRDEVKVILHAARPGIIIGKQGRQVERLQADLEALTGRRINIKIEEIGRPELDAQLIAEDIAEQLSRRASFRRTMKKAADQTMQHGARGIKIQLSGRLGGSEMARTEMSLVGSIPLATLQAKIDYGFTEAWTPQGHIGVKVWVNQGRYFEEGGDGADAQAGQVPKKPKRTHKR